MTNTYQYVFDVPDIVSTYKWPKWYRGSSHGAELEFLVGLQNDPRIPYSKDYYGLSDTMLYYWINFANSGLFRRCFTFVMH